MEDYQGLIFNAMKKFLVISLCISCLASVHAHAQEAVGGMGGAFSVSPMGGATYSIPIDVPQGVGGLQPQLSIVYNSQSGNGLCGYGATLAGLSSITRGPKDIYHDSIAQGIKYQADDALYLDGVRLILSSGIAGQNGAVYNPESDPFTNVITHGNCTSTSNNTWYEVQKSDGTVCLYGCSSTSRSSLNYSKDGVQKILSWHLDRVSQPTGNYVEYYYDIIDNCVYLMLMAYGSNLYHSNSLSNIVQFTYETSNGIPIFFDDQHGSLNKRLKTITCTTNDHLYRSYTLNYDSDSDSTDYKYSRLTGVTEKNGSNDSLPSVQFNWSYLPAVSYHSNSLSVSIPSTPANVSLPFEDQIYVSGDLNNDGLDDIAGLTSEVTVNGQIKSYLYIYWAQQSNASISYSNGLLFEMPDLFNNTRFIDRDMGDFHSFFTGSAIVDWNGDGNNEILLPYYQTVSGNRTMKFYVNGYIPDSQSDWSDIVTCPLNTSDGTLYSIADLNNDGRKDIMVLEKAKNGSYYTCHILSYDPSLPDTYSSIALQLSLPSAPRQVYLSDMNSNGLNDLLVICKDNYAVYWNQGGANITTSTFSDSYKVTGSNLEYWSMTTAGDFNGDGLLDILTNGSDDSSWYFNINQGDGSFCRMQACSLSVYNQNFTARDNDKFHCDVFDFDGDGKDDVVITKATYEKYSDWSGSWGEFDKTHTYWMRSTGTTLEQEYHATSNKASDALTNRFFTGDFNGDGLRELACYGYDCVNGVNANTSPIWRLFKHDNYTVQTGKVTSIIGDFGVTTSITYSTLTDQDAYTRGNAEPYPAPRYTIPINVVKQTVESNGAAGNMTTEYSYQGLKIHLKGRGSLGFNKIVANNTTTGVSVESGIIQWDTIYYLPKVTYTKSIIGNVFAQSVDSLYIVNKGQKKYFAYPSVTVETDMDGNSVTTSRSYDTIYGYPTAVTTSYGAGMYRSVSYSDYIQTTAGVYLPRTITTSQKHADDNTVFSTTDTCSYDLTTGAVLKRVQYVGTSKPLTTQYTYDSWGNLTSKVSTGNGVTPCTTYYTYDSKHRSVVRIYTNPSSSVTKYTYNQWGDVLTEQDSINASVCDTVYHYYDNWGNRVRTQMPDGSEITWSRGWGSSTSQRWFVLEQGTSRPWVKTWYDNHGREVMTESKGPMNVDITATTTYNTKGQVISRTETSGDLILTHSYTYDSRGRIAGETAPGGRTVTYQYGNRSVTVTENSSRTTVKTYDAWGNLKTLTDPVSSITNTYSSKGGIKQTVSGGATWNFGYDDRGFRSSATDPDAGTTAYIYDAMGRETKRTDARGVAFVTTYDYLGRVTRYKAGVDAINYTYGSSGNGQLRLASESYNGWTKSYTYDNLGRVIGETMSNGTITKSRSYTYGTDGMLATRTLPGGKIYSYSYDDYGNVTGVNAAGSAVKWSLTGYTGKRTTSSTVLNNSTYYSFNKATVLDQYGYLDSLITNKNGSRYQDDDYNFSPLTGNLMSLDANWMDYPHTFQYDSADRLTRVQENNQDIMYMTYSANGNILSKTGIGYYEYSNTTQPHAVTAVDNFENWIEDTIQYVSYNSWGKLESLYSVRDGDVYYYSIEYGPDIQRVRSSLYKNGQPLYSKFYWDDYEEKTVDNTTYLYWYVNGGDGLAGIMLGNAQNSSWSQNLVAITDHLGSIMILMDNYDCYYSCNYDVWGNRTIGMESYPVFDRGFCGHEHIDEIGLIDMNGRMYDPKLGRFLSPDPYVQSPTNPQNFNRYSYCLNNPLKYTDPSGEIYGTLFGLISDFVNNIGRTFEGKKWDWIQTKNGFEIDKGLFMMDPNQSTGGKVKEFFSRITWQLPQTLLGDIYVSTMNAAEKVNNVTHGYGVTAVDMGLDGAVTLGYISAGPEGYKADWHDHMFVHEYGHYLQSQEMGFYYLFGVGIPSLQSAIVDTQKNNAPKHGNRWFETDANSRSAEYFDKYYGSGCDDYDSNSEDFFDKISFCYGTESKYLNPRKGNYNIRKGGYPFESISHWTDFWATIPVFGLLPYFLYK